ncbi:MAG: Brp/Blh family beta-carotene 15,15'-dioxygenase [Rubrobacter sp.]|nr:Brp/Blh family beta-carotene 15,15'-dioxygenase [Rubrobacter sp.]
MTSYTPSPGAPGARPPGSGPDLPEPKARRTLFRAFVVPSWVLVAALALSFLLGLQVSEPLQYLPFALSLVLFGLPHGAVDHLVPARLSGREASLRSVLGVALLYLVLAGLYLAVWFASPVAAFLVFVSLTWFHWGQGDLHARLALPSGEPTLGVPPALTVLVRGGLPMLVPLISFPEVYREVALGIVGVFGAGELGWAAVFFEPVFRLAAGTAFLSLVVAVLYLGYRRAGSGGAWRTDAAEVLLLLLYFSVVPPVLAVGLYFCLWHSPRHVARLMLLEREGAAALRRGRLAPALRAFVRDAAPLTLAALALLAGLYLAVPGTVEGYSSLLGLYLVLISVLTLPHVAVVYLMDRKQDVWRGDRPAGGRRTPEMFTGRGEG